MGELSSPSPNSVRIFLVDDFEPWRRSVCSILQTQQHLHVVGEAADGLEAIRRAEELQPDLILMDIRLPKLNGMEAARRIREITPGAKIIFVTQNADVEVISTAMEIGALGYVWKGDTGRDLLRAIDTVLRGKKFVSSGLKG